MYNFVRHNKHINIMFQEIVRVAPTYNGCTFYKYQILLANDLQISQRGLNLRILVKKLQFILIIIYGKTYELHFSSFFKGVNNKDKINYVSLVLSCYD